MAIRKRTASSSAGRPAKKKPAADTVTPLCAKVAAELKGAEGLSASCRAMLAQSVKTCLGVYAESRHAYQAKAVEMVGKALADVEAQLEAAIVQAKAKVDSADAEKKSRDDAVKAAEATLGDLEGKLKAAQETYDNDTAAKAAAASALASATKAVKDRVDDIDTAGANKAKLALALEDGYGPLKTFGRLGQEGRKALSSLAKVLLGFDMEKELVDSLSETLSKEPSARRTYDALVIKHVDAQTAALVAKVEAALQAAEASKAQADTTKTTSEATHDASVGKIFNAETGSKVLREAAGKAKDEGKAALSAAMASVKSYDKDMKEAAQAEVAAKQALDAFKDGPAKAFGELKDLAPPPPPPEPEPVPEAAAVPETVPMEEAPPAEAPPATAA